MMGDIYCPACQETNCYKDGICSICNFTVLNEDDLRCPLCASEVQINGPTTSCYHDAEDSSVPKYVPECMDYGCLPDIPNIDDVPKETKEDTVKAFIELCVEEGNNE
jgi:hypothetical protein